MHLVIVEDLKSDRDNLIERIQENSDAAKDTAELSVYTSGEALLSDFRRGFCSAIFLDIMLGEGMNGLDTARKIRETDEYIPIVFTTTEKEFALESYGVHAMDFLVKPIEQAPLDWCMKRLRETLVSPTILTVRCSIEGWQTFEQVISLDDILFLESVRNGSVIHTSTGEVRSGQSYSELMRLLPKTGRFCEYGRGTTVNFSWVDYILDNGEIRLKNGVLLFCSRRKLKETRAAYNNYQFMVLRKEGVNA
ncbi:MAG: LytTR family DNA-binding domain-containing protein [Lachnospiraceae bacterium]|nr:LytTR family DNA-binding domain-containing protein [Lachnospiraceae bacterium]